MRLDGSPEMAADGSLTLAALRVKKKFSSDNGSVATDGNGNLTTGGFTHGAGVLAFFGSSGSSAQPAPSGNLAVGSSGSSGGVCRDTTFTGGVGSTGHTIGDIVAA